ncbi:MAG TPA: NAD(P)-dependent oxidoreductase [Steroidobacteraceae bacterium]|nr:NAD(P)-dependent oxidoreductase [Steroidobacteraceae bacterium]
MKAGFIGLGAMGLPMAWNLHRAGLLAGAWNRTASKATALASETGCRAFATPAELAAACAVVVTCVSADEDLLAVVDAIRPTLKAGAIVIDCSTVAADTARAAASRLAGIGAGFLDCPVSGGVEGAKNATLAIMCGGNPETFERAKPALEALGKTIVLMGPSGAGQATKATNQILCAGAIQVAAEAMAFAQAEGLPLERVIEILGKGAGASWYFVHRAPFMARGEYPAGFRVRLHDKDLRICREMAARHGATLPVIEATLADYARLIAGGHGEEDISTIFRLKVPLFSGPGRDG